MATKTRRDARKGRSTRRAVKRGGMCFGGLCGSRGPKLYSRAGIRELLINNGWSVRDHPHISNNQMASCGAIEQNIAAIYHKGDDAWEYPTNKCTKGKISPKNINLDILPATSHPYDGAHVN